MKIYLSELKDFNKEIFNVFSNYNKYIRDNINKINKIVNNKINTDCFFEINYNDALSYKNDGNTRTPGRTWTAHWAFSVK